jgi:hypothetical protein
MFSTARTHRRHALLALVGALAAVALVGAAPLGAAGKYTDAPGDSHGAPDITGVSVAGDPNGQILFTISTADLPPEAGIEVLLVLNTDLDSSTGGPGTLGADYFFYLDIAERSYGFARWTGTEWDYDTPYATVRVGANRSGATFSVNRSELGGTQSLNFWARTIRGDYDAGQVDEAPNDGTWNYTLAANGPDIQEVLVTMNPTAGPKAGQSFALVPAGLRLPLSDGLGLMPQAEAYTCTATLGKTALAGSGTGACTYKLKKSARGKKLSVALTVTYQGASKTAQYVYRVR